MSAQYGQLQMVTYYPTKNDQNPSSGFQGVASTIMTGRAPVFLSISCGGKDHKTVFTG